MSRHAAWIEFVGEYRALLAETGLPPIAFRSEGRLRELFTEGSTCNAQGERATLTELDSAQWKALERFAEHFFREFESWAPLDLFRAFSQELQRRGGSVRW